MGLVAPAMPGVAVRIGGEVAARIGGVIAAVIRGVVVVEWGVIRGFGFHDYGCWIPSLG